MFMTPTARPTNDYEGIDNTKRNMYEGVSVFNGSAGPVEVIYDRTNYGVLGAGETKNFPKFVAEWLIGRNLLYKIVDGGDPEAIEAIERSKGEMAGAELTNKAQAEALVADAKAARKAHGKKLKDAAEAIEEETTDVEDEVEEPVEEEEEHFDKRTKK